MRTAERFLRRLWVRVKGKAFPQGEGGAERRMRGKFAIIVHKWVVVGRPPSCIDRQPFGRLARFPQGEKPKKIPFWWCQQKGFSFILLFSGFFSFSLFVLAGDEQITSSQCGLRRRKPLRAGAPCWRASAQRRRPSYRRGRCRSDSCRPRLCRPAASLRRS